MKVVLNKRTENFAFRREYKVDTGESNDGYRRGISFTIKERTEFLFENETKEEGGYSYDFSVIKYSSYYGVKDLTEDMHSSTRDFDYVASTLAEKGLFMLNVPAYMMVDCKVRTIQDEEHIDVSFDGSIKSATEEDVENSVSAKDLMARLSEQDSEAKQMRLNRAVGDSTEYDKKYKVDLNSIGEFYGKKQSIVLPKVNLDKMISSGEISLDDIQGIYENVVKTGHHIEINSNEKHIGALPETTRRQVLSRCWHRNEYVDLYRQYYPEGIRWRWVPFELFKDSDLELMTQCGEEACGNGLKFVIACLEKPELAEIVARNAYVLCKSNLHSVLKRVDAKLSTVALRSMRGLEIDPSKVSDFLYANFESLEPADYEMLVNSPLVEFDAGKLSGYDKAVRKSERNAYFALVLRIGKLVGIEDAELEKMLIEKSEKYDLCLFSRELASVYDKFDFAPGLAWVKAEEDRQAEIRRQKEEQAIKDNERVVRFAQQAACPAVFIGIQDPIWKRVDEDHNLYHPLTNERIGRLLPEERRVVFIEGYNYGYLFDVERIKKIRGGTFKLYVYESDTGSVIGYRGENIKKLTRKLNELGCNIRFIKVEGIPDRR